MLFTASLPATWYTRILIKDHFYFLSVKYLCWILFHEIFLLFFICHSLLSLLYAWHKPFSFQWSVSTLYPWRKFKLAGHSSAWNHWYFFICTSKIIECLSQALLLTSYPIIFSYVVGFLWFVCLFSFLLGTQTASPTGYLGPFCKGVWKGQHPLERRAYLVCFSSPNKMINFQFSLSFMTCQNWLYWYCRPTWFYHHVFFICVLWSNESSFLICTHSPFIFSWCWLA